MKKPLRANQRDGFVSEACAEASSKVENLKRIAGLMEGVDPRRAVALKDLYRKARNYREQVRVRLEPLEEIDDELYTPELLDEAETFSLELDREKLFGEIFIRLYHIDTLSKTAKKVLGA